VRPVLIHVVGWTYCRPQANAPPSFRSRIDPGMSVKTRDEVKMSRAVGAVRELLLRPSQHRKCDFHQFIWVAHTWRRPLSACMRPVGVHPRMAAYIAPKGVAAYAPPNFQQFSRAEGPMGTDRPKGDWFAQYPSEGFEKDVKIVGTNSITSLESVKASKNELKTNSKRTQI